MKCNHLKKAKVRDIRASHMKRSDAFKKANVERFYSFHAFKKASVDDGFLKNLLERDIIGFLKNHKYCFKEY